MGRTERGAEAFAAALEAYLGGALAAAAPDDARCEALDGVAGARVVRRALREEECAAMEAIVREVHGESVGSHRESGHLGRRESQHHVALQVADEAMRRLGKRLRPWLDAEAGPKNPKKLEREGAELSSFLRTYCYQEGDASTPHFDKAYTEHAAKGSADQHLVRFSAFSVVMYLNEGFEGGETTFFQPDPAIKPSRRGNTPIIADPSVLRVAGANVPRKGDVLIFPHGTMPGSYPNPLHEGSVLVRGSKCIIRTDVLYQGGPARKKGGAKQKAAKKTKKMEEAEDDRKAQDDKADETEGHATSGSASEGADSSETGLGIARKNARRPRTPSQNHEERAKMPRVHADGRADPGSAVAVVEKMLQDRLAHLCPSQAHLAAGSLRRLGEAHKPEFVSRLPSTVYWALFRAQRAARPDAQKVLLVSALGVERELSRDEVARALIEELPSEHPLAFVSASEDGSGRLFMSSKAHVARQGEGGQVMCVKCGAFVRAATGGLEWHLKTAHGVETHQVAFEAVQRQTDALFALRASPVTDSAGATADATPQRLDPKDVARAMRERGSLESAVAAGRIRSLGPELDACRSGDLEALRAAVAAGWDASKAEDRNGANGLLWAAGFGNLDVCKFLVRECKLDPVHASQRARRGYSMRTALHWAARNGHLEVVQWLVEDESCPADVATGDGTTPLCLAAWQGHVDTCTYLIEKAGADPHTTNSFGCNLAMWVAQSPAHESALALCTYLLPRGVDFTRINHNGQGCLHKAAQRGNRAVCEWLLREAELGPEHFAPNENEKSRPSELAKFAGHDALAEDLSAREAAVAQVQET